MRLWSIHPQYLDAAGLVACWREALLAQKVLAGHTRGYTRHPQIQRFLEQPGAAIGDYLHGIADEADARGYRFRRELITHARDSSIRIPVTDGQLSYEWRHLMSKLATRSPNRHSELARIEHPLTHPLFDIVPGGVASWEVVGHSA